ncbi:oligopeptide ABC transporter substrate-binding protein [Vagococcus fluvialis]|uniref:oligopeptide ABC transporter substrate-binding protein n=1 Tax=Vagococcus fluvialis TaxID=2738 RepID=UPI001432C46B|nr:oligopeptide ABC transporter substrate-binding protein [Vagococcus fluvialis]MBO0486424.1 oligopeptide ABC transporter substrate-binding protein [Vagococcus fluvialis]NKC59267.1 oligopeptide ABC transporter substrate-binding protein [Vagococcus fluvialis]NKD50337.1 oligopeptide ABC transporter substrate-binding protein [Vagococcus fluvialis]
MKYKKLVSAMALGAAVTVGLAACGGKKDDGKKSGDTKQEDVSQFPIEVSNKEKAKEGGTLEVAVAMDTQFAGLFVTEFYENNYDAQFMLPSHEEIFRSDSNFETTDGGIVKKDIDVDKKTIKLTITKDAKWSDGEPLVAEDLIQPYLVIAHPDYAGIRYGEDFTNVVGVEEYHDGKADSISGLKKIDDKSIEITYKEMNPGMKQTSETVWSSAMPAHIFKDMPVKGMESSDPVRKSPVTLGPYKMTKINQGESVEYTPNEFYYGEKPKLEKIVMRVAPTNSITEAMKAKKYDMVLSMPTDNYPSYKDIEGYEILGRPDLAYTYIGFKLGKWDEKAGKVAYNPESKMANKELRQAMAYAVDNNAIGEKYYHGLRQAANAMVPPIFSEFSAKDLEGYTKQDIEKANKLLDDAGYKKKDGEEFRRDPKGEKLEIKFASMAGGETAQPLAEYYVNCWREIGLDVSLATGRLIEFNSFYDKLKNDDPEIDVYQAAWGLSADPSQSGLYAPTASFNYTRFESDKNTELMNNIDSEKSFDTEYRAKAFKEWQEYASDEAFVFPTLFRDQVLPVSENVTGFTWAYDAQENPWASIGLTK